MEEWLDFSSLIEQVQELFDLNLYDDGLKLLDKYKNTYANEWEIHFLYSRAYSEQNKPEQAIPHLTQGLKASKDNPDCLLGLFYAYSQMNQMQKGVRYLLKAKKLYPNNDLILNALIWYYLERNDFNKAITCYENSRALLDNNSESLRNIGIAYERIGNFDKAVRCFENAVWLNQDFDEARDLLADHYILRGDVSKSIDLYKNYLKNSPKNIHAMSRLVFCLSQNDQFEEAEKACQDIIRTYPNSPVGYVDLSYVYLNKDQIELSIETADKALDVLPIDAEAYRVKGIAYSEQNNFLEAEKNFIKAMSLSSNNSEIMRDYYHHLKHAGRFKEMENVVHKVIAQEYPYCIEDYWFFADYYRDKGQNLKAFHYLNKAYRSMPGEKEIIPPMIEILLDMGHVSSTVPILKRYIEAKGWDTIMHKLYKHKRLQGKWSQEGLRFLQFYGQKPVEFRKSVFSVYLKKTMLLAFYLLLLPILILSYLYLGLKATILMILTFIAVILINKGRIYLRNKKLTS
jgi:tetratricopeptide (TPR) repeat protein